MRLGAGLGGPSGRVRPLTRRGRSRSVETRSRHWQSAERVPSSGSLRLRGLLGPPEGSSHSGRGIGPRPWGRDARILLIWGAALSTKWRPLTVFKNLRALRMAKLGGLGFLKATRTGRDLGRLPVTPGEPESEAAAERSDAGAQQWHRDPRRPAAAAGVTVGPPSLGPP